MVARRPWGLMIAVLLLDIGLAVAGAWMLSQGLGDRTSAPRERARTSSPAGRPRTVELTPVESADPGAAHPGSGAATSAPGDASVAAGSDSPPPRSR